MKVKCLIAVHNSNGQPDLVNLTVTCSPTQYDNGDHYQMAKEAAEEQGYDPVWVADEFDPGFVELKLEQNEKNPTQPKRARTTKIDWDTDGDKEAFASLPQVVEINLEEVEVDEIADFLSDTYGFCVHSYDYEIVGPTIVDQILAALDMADDVTQESKEGVEHADFINGTPEEGDPDSLVLAFGDHTHITVADLQKATLITNGGAGFELNGETYRVYGKAEIHIK